jgi:hypothetical protein
LAEVDDLRDQRVEQLRENGIARAAAGDRGEQQAAERRLRGPELIGSGG